MASGGTCNPEARGLTLLHGAARRVIGQKVPVELRSLKEAVFSWLPSPTGIPQQYPTPWVLRFYKPAQARGSFGHGLCSAGCWRVPWPVPSPQLGWLSFQPVPIFSDLCYYPTLKPHSISRGAQHGLWHGFGTGVCTGSGAVPSNRGALPWQGDPGDAGEDGAKGTRGDTGSPGLPGERVGARSLLREAAGQQDGQCSAGEPGVLVCRGRWVSTQDPLLSPHAPLLSVSLSCRAWRAPVAPPVHG